MDLRGQHHATATLHPGKEPPVYSYYKGGGPRSLSGRFRDKKNLPLLPVVEPPLVGRPVHLLSLYRLQYPCYPVCNYLFAIFAGIF